MSEKIFYGLINPNDVNQRISEKERYAYWYKKLGNKTNAIFLIKYLDSPMKEKNAIKVYNLIETIFLINGFSEEDALEYVNQNIKLLLLDKSRIVTMLAIMNKGNIENKVLFEAPHFFFKEVSLSNLYAVSNEVKNQDYISASTFIRKVLENKNTSILPKSLFTYTINSYMNKLNEEKKYLNDYRKELK